MVLFLSIETKKVQHEFAVTSEPKYSRMDRVKFYLPQILLRPYFRHEVSDICQAIDAFHHKSLRCFTHVDNVVF